MPDGEKQVIELKRLGEVGSRVDLLGPNPSIPGRGHDNNRYLESPFLESACDTPAVEYRHPHVQQEEEVTRSVKTLNGFNEAQSLSPVGGGGDRITLPLKNLSHCLADRRIVIND